MKYLQKEYPPIVLDVNVGGWLHLHLGLDEGGWLSGTGVLFNQALLRVKSKLLFMLDDK